jgi:hypothetical protein
VCPDGEFVEEVREVLFHGCEGDDEFVGDGSCRCGFGEHVACQERPAECDEDVLFACGESWQSVFDVGFGFGGSGRLAKQQAGLADADSSSWRTRREDQMRSPLSHVPLEDPERLTLRAILIVCRNDARAHRFWRICAG